MKSDNDVNVEVFELGDFSREPVPSTEALQASILESARQLPQNLTSRGTSSPSALGNWLSWYKETFHSPALVALALVLMISLFAVDFGDSQLPQEVFNENDLEWQELMLIEDDLLFAQL